MKDEIAATVFFITRLVKKQRVLTKQQMEKFASKLMAAMFEMYKSHWYPDNPSKGQAFRCIRINQFNPRDPLLERACLESNVDFSSLGLPKEMTIWVDPFDVCCRYGENNQPFTVAHFEGDKKDHDVPQLIRQAVDKAEALDCPSSNCSDEEGATVEPKSIPTVSNPNSVYQCNEPFQLWSQYPRRKLHVPDGFYQHPTSTCYLQCKGYKVCRPSATFTGPRVDRYHWVNANR
ncbi:protein BTG4 isoform X1 [Lacerta agilis]|uniref:protein BTG4 isoform X1 n=1 Tax=Lacerta agilis TaxID=80427 RepID=UPI001419B5C3|nr:protein BTG4 isoform X1 [Lacerta agilis]